MKFTETVKNEFKEKIINLHPAEMQDPVQAERLSKAIDIAIDLLVNVKNYNESKRIVEMIPGIINDLYDLIEI